MHQLLNFTVFLLLFCKIVQVSGLSRSCFQQSIYRTTSFRLHTVDSTYLQVCLCCFIIRRRKVRLVLKLRYANAGDSINLLLRHPYCWQLVLHSKGVSFLVSLCKVQQSLQNYEQTVDRMKPTLEIVKTFDILGGQKILDCH